MNIGRLRISERQQVAAIILTAAVGIFAIGYFLLLPQGRARRMYEERERSLARSEYSDMSPRNLRLTREHHESHVRRLWDEWRHDVGRLATFAQQDVLRRSEVGRIDFKVDLYRTRQRLNRKSERLGIQLVPTDLGMPDAVLENIEARMLMIQLRAVEKLADLTLDRRIQRLLSIHPLPPREHQDLNDNHAFDEYPVAVEFEVSFENLYALLHAVFESDRVFVFRQIRVQAGETLDAHLRVKAVMSALVFEEPIQPAL